MKNHRNPLLHSEVSGHGSHIVEQNAVLNILAILASAINHNVVVGLKIPGKTSNKNRIGRHDEWLGEWQVPLVERIDGQARKAEARRGESLEQLLNEGSFATDVTEGEVA